MRILYHHRTLADGAEGIHIAEMVTAFRGLGHEVQVHGFGAAGASSGRGQLAARIKRTLPHAAFEAASAASNALDYLEMRRAIREWRPDFMYKRHARLDIGAVAAARRAGVPTVLEVNALFTGASYMKYEPIAFDRTAARFERRVLVDADIVLAVSTPLAASIERLCGVEATVMPNGADPVRFDSAHADRAGVRARLGLGAAFTVGWVGIMREWHGLELLIDAFSGLPGARLLLVGDGPAREAVERYASSKGVRERVTVTGRVSPDRMPDHIAAMDVAVVASDRTGIASPMKLLEYMAMERAVIAPRLASIQDLVTDGRNGLLFTPEDVQDLARRLLAVAADRSVREDLGRQGRLTIVGGRNWRSNATRVIELVDLHRSRMDVRTRSSGVSVRAPEATRASRGASDCDRAKYQAAE